MGGPLPAAFVTDHEWLWRLRLAQIAADPAAERWIARAMHRELLRRAEAGPAVRTVRASISPVTPPLWQPSAGWASTQVGEQWDDEDGLELVFEVVGARR
jgi:hypothetical protein